jgi:uncharacterized protein (DUF1330 family)
MKSNYKVAFALGAVAVGATIVGAVGGTFLYAQTAVPPAYVIAEVQVTDPDIWKQYVAALPGTLAPYKVRTLARTTPVALDSSTPPAGTLVVLAFNSMEDVKAFWNSPAYQAIIPLREKSAKTRVYAVQGMPPS